MYIQIIDDPDQTFTYRPHDPETDRESETELELRLVPDDVQREFRKQCRTQKWRRGVQVTTLDDEKWVSLCLNYAIVGWRNLFAVTLRDGKVIARKPVPFEDRYKAMLPEHVKVSIVRMCVNKEAGNTFDDEQAETAREEPAAADPLLV